MPASRADHRERPAAVKVLVVDDHPALREGLERLLREEEGFLPLAALHGAAEIAGAIDALGPDVVVLDYALEREDGLSACFRIKQRPDPPGVVMYSAYADTFLAVPATLAQADGMVSKTAPIEELLGILRSVAAGERRMPALHAEAVHAASARLAPEDLAVAGMLFSRIESDEIAATLAIEPAEVRARALRIIGALQAKDRIARDGDSRHPSFSPG